MLEYIQINLSNMFEENKKAQLMIFALLGLFSSSYRLSSSPTHIVQSISS